MQAYNLDSNFGLSFGENNNSIQPNFCNYAPSFEDSFTDTSLSITSTTSTSINFPKPTKGARITDDQLNTILKINGNDVSNKDIALFLNIPAATVSRVKRQHNKNELKVGSERIPGRKKLYGEYKHQNILKKIIEKNMDLGFKQISKAFGEAIGTLTDDQVVNKLCSGLFVRLRTTTKPFDFSSFSACSGPILESIKKAYFNDTKPSLNEGLVFLGRYKLQLSTRLLNKYIPWQDKTISKRRGVMCTIIHFYIAFTGESLLGIDCEVATKTQKPYSEFVNKFHKYEGFEGAKRKYILSENLGNDLVFLNLLKGQEVIHLKHGFEEFDPAYYALDLLEYQLANLSLKNFDDTLHKLDNISKWCDMSPVLNFYKECKNLALSKNCPHTPSMLVTQLKTNCFFVNPPEKNP